MFSVIVVLISVLFFLIEFVCIVMFIIFVFRCLFVSLKFVCVWVEFLKNILIWVSLVSVFECFILCWFRLIYWLVRFNRFVILLGCNVLIFKRCFW